MAVTHGKGGSVTFAGDTTYVESWTLDASASVAESTSMAAAEDYKSYVPGFKNWTASVEVINNADPAIHTHLGATAALTLTDGALTHVAEATAAVCTGIDATMAADGVRRHTYHFQGVGAITNV